MWALVWVMFGFGVGVYVPCSLPLFGFCLGFIWFPCGFNLASFGILCGFDVASVWVRFVCYV